MNILDIIALAKAGYTAKDVKELMTLETANEDISSKESEEVPDRSKKEDIDYKALYEKSIEEINTLKADKEKTASELKEAQINNTNDNISSDIIVKEKPIDVWTNFFKER